MNRPMHRNDLSRLPRHELDALKADLKAAARDGLMVSVRVEEHDGWVETYVYESGVFTMTPEEAEDYKRNGGLWGYDTPENVAKELGIDLGSLNHD